MRKPLVLSFFLIGFSLLINTGCGGDIVYTPKPRAYPKVEFPDRKYEPFQEDYCNFSFKKAGYMTVEQDTLFFDEKPMDPCWFDLTLHDFKGKIHFSYRPLDKENTLFELGNDVYKMANKHQVKASMMEDHRIDIPKKKIHGVGFSIGGPVACPYQFFITDSTDHFLRGALYFNSQPEPDSLAPIVNFVKEDIEKILESFEWAD